MNKLCNLAYSLRLSNLILRDKDEQSCAGGEKNESSLKFHLRCQDYFGTIATVLDLMGQDREEIERRHKKILQKLKGELVFLQKNYRIVKNKNATKIHYENKNHSPHF